jgi:MoaA/NifB/PqqE/SkfB family radical SAM enzyme
MSFETFKAIIDKFPIVNGVRTLLQLAVGVDSEATANPQLFEMMKYARSVGIIPNLTVANITEETAKKIASVAGACAVSRYFNKNVCYDSVERLDKAGLKQINIHVITALESYDWIMETMNDRLTDPRLKNVRAIVLLSLKKQGRGKTFNHLPNDKFKKIVDFALEKNIGTGFDSCGCNLFLEMIKNHLDFEQIKESCEPCEASCFSSYISVDAKYLPCSFCSKMGNWGEGIDVLSCKDFIKDIWQNEKTKKFRSILLEKNRECPYFQIGEKR